MSHNALAVGMLVVLCAGNALVFLFAWEVMGLASFLLVLSNHRRDGVRQAAWLYLLATHLGAAFLLFALFQSIRPCGSLNLADFAALKTLPAGQAGLLFLAFLAGFGSKAGLLPLHVWLPDAHPAAPSHVSALMSGVMVKTGIYGLLRMATFLPVLPGWCGAILAVLGLAGALFGIADQAHACRKLQAGQLNIYLFYIFAATTLLLGVAMFTS